MVHSARCDHISYSLTSVQYSCSSTAGVSHSLDLHLCLCLVLCVRASVRFHVLHASPLVCQYVCLALCVCVCVCVCLCVCLCYGLLLCLRVSLCLCPRRFVRSPSLCSVQVGVEIVEILSKEGSARKVEGVLLSSFSCLR